MKTLVIPLFFSLSAAFAQASDTCFSQSEAIQAIEFLLFDHGGRSSVDEYQFSSGRHVVQYSTVRNIFLETKGGFTKTYWLHIVMTGGRVLNFETKNKTHAIDAVKAIKCLRLK